MLFYILVPDISARLRTGQLATDNLKSLTRVWIVIHLHISNIISWSLIRVFGTFVVFIVRSLCGLVGFNMGSSSFFFPHFFPLHLHSFPSPPWFPCLLFMSPVSFSFPSSPVFSGFYRFCHFCPILGGTFAFCRLCMFKPVILILYDPIHFYNLLWKKSLNNCYILPFLLDIRI